MYLEIVIIRKKRAVSTFIGPFSLEEAALYKEDWLETLGGHGALVKSHKKLPKGKKAHSVRSARLSLLIAEIARDVAKDDADDDE